MKEEEENKRKLSRKQKKSDVDQVYHWMIIL